MPIPPQHHERDPPIHQTYTVINIPTNKTHCMKHTKRTHQELLQIIEDPARDAIREHVSIKSKLLFEYLRPPMSPEGQFEAWAEECAEIAVVTPPNNPRVSRDNDGDIALAQPYAEMFILSGSRWFGGSIAMILMAETCYEPTVGIPARLPEALVRFRGLVGEGALPPAKLLHEFLEVDDSLPNWLAQHFERHRMIPGRDYVRVPEEGIPYFEDCMMPILFRPEVVAKIAVTTVTLRGRKIKCCLTEPGVRSDLADNDPRLLDLLFTPPVRGLASL